MIEVKNLNKSFEHKIVLNNISCTFEKGKINLIIGGSGSGKTVFQKCIVGLLTPESGTVLYDGRDFLNMNKNQKKEVRQDIGMLFQGGALFDSLTVEQNVMFPLTMFTDMTFIERRARANECLKRVNLDNVNKLFPSEISGGMKKRVAIARAISNNPKYLFCDEPNSGLDPVTSLVIDNLIKDITEEYDIITIINTHDMNSVIEIGERIVFLYKGNLEWQGTNRELMEVDNVELNNFIFATKIMQNMKHNSNNQLS
ncbi:MAG: ATP-binding cassette domain-containing protein [Bacteroidia bacterium]